MPNFTAKLVVQAVVKSDHLSAEEVYADLAKRLQVAISQGLLPEIADSKLTIVSFDTAVDATNEPCLKEAIAVKATVCSDDNKVCASFDSAKWFEQASDDEIMTLACSAEWGASDIADDIAHYYVDTNAEVANVFHYLSQKADSRTPASYECYVDPLSALAWLKCKRPHLHRLLQDD